MLFLRSCNSCLHMTVSVSRLIRLHSNECVGWETGKRVCLRVCLLSSPLLCCLRFTQCDRIFSFQAVHEHFFFLNFILNQRCTLADLISRPQFSCSLPGLNIIFTVRDRRDKRLGIFLIPNLKIQQLPDLLSRHGAFNQHKLDHSPQFNKTLLQGLPYDNNRAFRSFVAESAQSP